ncbi:MAG: tetratricopeptide repeat protein [Flavobacteriaceae bacterium]
MKKLALLISILLVSNLQSQKKELRQVDKLITQSFFDEANSELNNIESLVLSSEDKNKALFFFYKSKVSNELENFEDAINSYNKLISINPSEYSSKIQTEIDFLKDQIETSLVNSAVADNQNENYSEASVKLYMAYNLNKDKNKDYLYYAAGSAVNSRDYEKALGHYLELKNINYTGIVNEYFVTNNETGVEEKVSESEYNLLDKSKDYSNPRIGKTESRYPEIVKNIALIYVQQGKNDVAIEAITEARNIQPDDTGLILNEADLYIRMSNNSDNEEDRVNYRAKFKDLMELAITKDPENGILYYNLGVISTEQGESNAAVDYYEKAINFKPDYVDAYLNLVSVILDGEQAIVDEMNSLGTSKKDNIRYDELKIERENLYKRCVPYLEKLIEVSPTNLDALKTLKNIYSVLGDNEGFKEVSAQINELEG